WWKWWCALAPEWCEKDEGGLPVTGKPDGRDWGLLMHLGANRMAALLLPLAWWRKAEGDVASDSWLRAVRDVAWV
ncbi:hypothetical protein B0H17DRAFT_849856, partial [Mycena rosella]